MKNITIGSSEIGAVLGINQYKSPLQLWHEKLGLAPKFEGNRFTKFGKHVESLVGELVGEDLNAKVISHNKKTVHPEFPFVTATPDFLLEMQGEEGQGVLEVKTSLYRWTDGPPPSYVAQLQWQMEVLGLEWGYLGAMCGGNAENLEIIRFERDREFAKVAIEKAKEFCELVKEQIEPVATASDDDRKILALLRSAEEEKEEKQFAEEKQIEVAKLFLKHAEVSKKMHQASEFEKALKEKKKEIENQILQLAPNGASVVKLATGQQLKIKTVHVAAQNRAAYEFVRLSLKY